MENNPDNKSSENTNPSDSYTKSTKGGTVWNLLGGLKNLFSNRTTAIAGVLVLVLGLGAGVVAVQRSTEYRQQAFVAERPLACGRMGDVDANGNISRLDSDEILANIAGKPPIRNYVSASADVNADGKVSIADAQIILQYVNGTISTFPACNKPTASNITGTHFVDKNRNGVFDTGESALNAIVQMSTNTTIPTTSFSSNSNGSYTFSSVSTGTFEITAKNPSGYIPTNSQCSSCQSESRISFSVPPEKVINFGWTPVSAGDSASQPPSPTYLKATCNSNTSVTLTWTAVSGATGYTATLRSPSGNIGLGTATNSQTRSVVAGTIYSWGVVAQTNTATSKETTGANFFCGPTPKP